MFCFVRATTGGVTLLRSSGSRLAAYNMVSGALQTSGQGSWSDTVGARKVLVAGLTIGAVAFAVVGMRRFVFRCCREFARAGVGKPLYHPERIYTIPVAQ